MNLFFYVVFLQSFFFPYRINLTTAKEKHRLTKKKEEENRPNFYRDRQAIGLEIMLRTKKKKEKCIQYYYYFVSSKEREREERREKDIQLLLVDKQ